MNIAMIGAGYVGLVTGACFSDFGWNVVCVDNEEDRIVRLNKGDMPIYEPGLGRLVETNIQAGRLSFTTNLTEAVATAQAVFIAVGTPLRPDDGHADLTDVFDAAREIAGALDGYTVVVTKSTVPVGTGRKVAEIIHDVCPDADFDQVSNPEFLREGSAIDDFKRPDRVVIGTSSSRACEVMRQLYRPLFLRETPMVFTTLETSELIKYAANCFLATKITFINEIADLCEKIGADVQDVASAIGLDGRIGGKFLHAGPGYGGSCFPKDARALISTARDIGAPISIIETVDAVNEARKLQMADKIIAACGGSVAGKTIAVLGVTFKPNTNDVRGAASLTIIPQLQAKGARINAFDPAGRTEAQVILEEVNWCDGAYEAMRGADALVIVTEWNEFRALDLDEVRGFLHAPVVIDLRNIYDPEEMAANGFYYTSIGRSSVVPNPSGRKSSKRARG